MNLLLWFKERFPAVSLLTALVLTSTTLTVFRYFSRDEVVFLWTDMIVALGLAAQLLFLRVVDEHKDYQEDLIIHPHRVLQKGLVTLSQLKTLGVFCLIVMTAVNVILGQESTWVWWLAMMTWTLLMTKEFFIKSFLKRHLTLYSISHLLVLPLMVLWVGSFSQSSIDIWNLSTALFMIFVFANGLVYEIVRKSKTSTEKSPSEVLFSDIWSPSVWSYSLFTLLLLIGSILFALLYNQLHVVTLLILAVALVLSIYSVREFARAPCEKSKKAIEGSTALYSLVTYLSILVTLFVV